VKRNETPGSKKKGELMDVKRGSKPFKNVAKEPEKNGSSREMISYDEITRDVASAEWERLKELPEGAEANHLLLGKVLSWCKPLKTTATLQKFIRQQYGVQIIPTHTYKCSKLFSAVTERRFASFTEADYDRLSLREAMRLSARIDSMTKAEIAEVLVTGINGRRTLRRRSKLTGLPNAGYIYVMVSSAYPSLTKLGRTLTHPIERAAELSRQTGAAKPLVAVWWERVSDCVKAEWELGGLFISRKDPVKNDWFDIQAKEAIEGAMNIGKH